MTLQRTLLTRGNSKVGEDVLLFSLPAGGECCPGATMACKSVCYALRPHTWMAERWQKEKYVINYKASRQPDFVERIVAELQRAKVRAERSDKPQLCRIHDSGDFYDAEYARKWIEIAKAVPTFTFWVYTRSWRVADIYPTLLELAALPNVQMWFSHDRDTGNPPRVEGIEWSWLQVDEELPTTPSDLIFREKKEGRQPARKINGVQVCPQESGHAEDRELTCQDCTICFREKSTPEVIQLISDSRNMKERSAMSVEQKANPMKSMKKRGPRNPEWRTTRESNLPSNEFPNENWSRDKLESFLLKGEGDIADWRRKTVHRQFEIGAAWHFLKIKLKADGEGLREWQGKHGLNHQTMNEREQLYNAYKDDPKGLAAHATKVAALEFKNLITTPRRKKSAEEVQETLEQVEHRIQEQLGRAKKRHDAKAGENDEALEYWTCEMVSEEFVAFMTKFRDLSGHIRHCLAEKPGYANTVRAYLLRLEEELQSIVELLPPVAVEV